MKQVVQPASGGPVRLIEVPRPIAGPTEVLVRTAASLISPGTERTVTRLARASLIAKARARPDLVRQVVRKAKIEGVAQATKSVRTRLAEQLPLGYSAAGIVLEVGEAVASIVPGALVATGGAGKANHAEIQAVPGLLCASVPDAVTPDSAAFATVASVALHGLRLAEVGPGGKVGVVGLGLIGQLMLRLARAMGCDVVGLDVAEFPVDRARASGAFALAEEGDQTTQAVLDWSRGRGCDAVLITAAGSSSDAVRRAPAICRDRATVVIVGDVGLNLERRPFYEKELTLRFARSYGPGRYERSYEEWGVDYPAGFVRWTEGRNMEAVLDLMARGVLHVEDLITHRFPIEEASKAYKLIEEGSESHLGILLTYSDAATETRDRPLRLRSARPTKAPSIGLIGAGKFASSVLVPAMRKAGFDRFVSVTSASGLSAHVIARRFGFEKAVSGADAVIEDPDVDVVVIATPHDSHASLAAQALHAGKAVFCEKPLALTLDDLSMVEAAQKQSGGVLFVGFNRRWSKPIERVKQHFSSGDGALMITYSVRPDPLPESHWYQDRRQGGRLIGEVCHFIDTCSALVDKGNPSVAAFATKEEETLLRDNLVVVLQYEEGSLATISYSEGATWQKEKERIDIQGRGRSASIADFEKVILDGRSISIRPQDKGHLAEMAAFYRGLTENLALPDFLASSRASIVAANSLRYGSDLEQQKGFGTVDPMKRKSFRTDLDA